MEGLNQGGFLMESVRFAAIPSLSKDFPKRKLNFYFPSHKTYRKRKIEKSVIQREARAIESLELSKEAVQINPYIMGLLSTLLSDGD